MNAASARATRIFGIPVKMNPKILVTGLVAFAGLLFWYNSRSDESSESISSAVRPAVKETPLIPMKPHPKLRTMATNSSQRETLRLHPVDPQSGNIDPTLRLDALERLAKIEPPRGLRNLFEISPPEPVEGAHIEIPTPVSPVIPVSAAAVAPRFNIPLKYYGFVHMTDPGTDQKGFFLDGDNILVAAEGDVLKAHYLVRGLTPTSARMEDTQLKQEGVLPVSPEAVTQ